MTSRALITIVVTWTLASIADVRGQTAAPPVPPMPPSPALDGLAPTAPADAARGPYDFALIERDREKRKARMGKGGWNLRIDVQMVAMPQARALQLLPELESEEAVHVEGAVKRIQDMIAKNEAKVTGWPHIVMFEGEHAIAESILEKRYPSEFDPPQQPQNFSPPKAATGPKEASLVPTSFETRNTGVTLEIEATTVFDDGKRIGIGLNPQRVTLVGNETFATGVTKDGATTHIDQPQFATEKTTTTVVVRNREHILLAVHHLHTPENEIEFFILHVVATKVD